MVLDLRRLRDFLPDSPECDLNADGVKHGKRRLGVLAAEAVSGNLIQQEDQAEPFEWSERFQSLEETGGSDLAGLDELKLFGEGVPDKKGMTSASHTSHTSHLS